MNISIELPEVMDLKPRISVIGIGGAGCNAVNNMIATGLDGVEFIAANTDAQALTISKAENRIQLGAKLTEGLGAGADPQIGLQAAEEAIEEIRSNISGSHMLFLAAGMGGGTGTGAVSVIAKAAREMDILTVAIVSKPFHFEGARRMRIAEAGIETLRECVDTLIVIPNQNLFHLANAKTTFAESFVMADNVLYSGIACIVDLIVKDGHINLDFADVKAIMKGMGAAMMGTGEASGENRATKAAKAAISNPLLTDISLRGAKGLLISIIGGSNLTLFEVDEAASCVKQEADPEANIIVGATFEEGMDESIRVSIVASGLPGVKVKGSQGAPHGSGGLVADRGPQHHRHVGHTTNAGALNTEASSPGTANVVGYNVASRDQESYPLEATKDLTQTQDTGGGDLAKSPGASPPPLSDPPQLPRQTNHSAASDPYLGQTSADEFARALSEVIGTADDQSQEVRKQTASEVNTGSQSWRSSDGVVIEDGFSPPLAPPPLPEPTDSSLATVHRAPAFKSKPPAELPRRLPDVADFPHIAQRAYHAQSEQLKPAGDMHTILKRLARLGRQADDESDKTSSSVESDTEAAKSASPGVFSMSGEQGSGNP